MCTLTTVTDVCNLQLAANSKRPKKKVGGINSEIINVDTGLADRCGSGILILINDDGTVQALWLTSLDFDHDDDVYRYFGQRGQ
jgi:hypothetical protein